MNRLLQISVVADLFHLSCIQFNYLHPDNFLHAAEINLDLCMDKNVLQESDLTKYAAH